jgi:hypothetical protein
LSRNSRQYHETPERVEKYKNGYRIELIGKIERMKERFKNKLITIGKLGKYRNLKELAKLAEKRYRNNTQGKSVINRDIGKVDFGMRGLKETIQTAKSKPEILKTLTKIREIIKYGKKEGTKDAYKERKDGAIAFDSIKKDVKYKGKKMETTALIRVLPRDVKDFYNLYLRFKKRKS